MKQIILATVIVLAISSCGNNSNKNNSDMGDTTKVTTLPPATDTMPASDTNMNQNRMSDTVQMKKNKDSLMKKNKDSANKKAKK